MEGKNSPISSTVSEFMSEVQYGVFKVRKIAIPARFYKVCKDVTPRLRRARRKFWGMTFGEAERHSPNPDFNTL
jgi:hypothetical protein